MLAVLLLTLIVASSFAAGYGTRTVVSRRNRERYAKWEPYVRPSRPSQPPQFLMRSDNRNVTSMKRAASGSRRSN